MGKTSALRGTNQLYLLIGSHSNLARIDTDHMLSLAKFLSNFGVPIMLTNNGEHNLSR
jgi:hypothetical protein